MANPAIKISEESFEQKDVFFAFERYPDEVIDKLLFLRQLIFETAIDVGINDVEETLKWGVSLVILPNRGVQLESLGASHFPVRLEYFLIAKQY